MLPDSTDLMPAAETPGDLSGFDGMQQHEFLPYRISVLSRIFDRQADRRSLTRRGLSLTDSRVLGHLFVNQQATVRGLAEEMHMHRPQISRAMSTLVRRNYARKRPDPGDRRSAVFTITAKGNRLYHEMIDSGRRGQRTLGQFLGYDRYHVLNDTLRVLIDAFGPTDADGE